MRTDYRNPDAFAAYTEIRENPENLPFHFTYNGKEYNGFPDGVFRKVSAQTTRNAKYETTETIFMLDNTLTVKLLLSYYPDYGVSEWTVTFGNDTDKNIGIISDAYTKLTFDGERPVLKGILGDHVNLYRPYTVELCDMPGHFVSDSGRPTHINFPYFNLEYGNGGVMLAIGWAGTWSADFNYSDGRTEYIAKSTCNLNTYLKPGETIRTALFVCAPYSVRDEAYATNFWRSWFIECNVPKWNAQGDKFRPFATNFLANDTGYPNSDGSISERSTTWKPSMDKMLSEGVNGDFRWFDAGWYIAPDGSSPVSDWWGTVGTWELDRNKWPGNSFRESTDYAREHGMKTLVWFEPERVTDPEALVRDYGYNIDWAIRREGCGTISNNIGNPDCLAWTTDRICKMLTENRVEMYREDNNCDPGALWRYLDSLEGDNRLGITECKIIAGHYKMWDDIIKCTLSIGGCGFVDSCASGGGRNDLESLRRGIPLLRSDSDRTSTALRLSMTSSFCKWVPFCGANTREKVGQLDATGRTDVYTWRASYLPVLNIDSQYVQDPDTDFALMRFAFSEWRSVNRYMTKNFYVLTPWHSEQDVFGFTAFSYYDPEDESGVILLFRMEGCGQDAITVQLPYVCENLEYILNDADTKKSVAVAGGILRDGYRFVLSEPRSARLIYIKSK